MQVMVVQVVIAGQFAGERLDPTGKGQRVAHAPRRVKWEWAWPAVAPVRW
jgi:hypothetical protein